MNRKSHGTTRAQGSWLESSDEIREFLDTWDFSISVRGYMIVENRKCPVTARDLRFFLERLAMVWNDDFPKLVLFEFDMRSNQQESAESLLGQIRQFAGIRNAISWKLENDDRLRIAICRLESLFKQ